MIYDGESNTLLFMFVLLLLKKRRINGLIFDYLFNAFENFKFEFLMKKRKSSSNVRTPCGACDLFKTIE
jgi:hypothetical protein